MSENPIEQIKKLRVLLEQGCTCALCIGTETLCSKERGIAPVLAWLNNGVDAQKGIVADKVVGKAAAYLYVLLGVAFVYANTMSKSAEEVFQRFGVEYEYDESVLAIRNRAGDGFCPMEQAVWDIDEPQTARVKIQETLQRLKEMKK